MIRGIFLICAIRCAHAITLSTEDAHAIGEKIWLNECGGRIERLTHWNEGEGFASLGIGHFIWYVEGKRERFDESFPDLMIYLQKAGASPPDWLRITPHCPWRTKEEFDADAGSVQMGTLRQFLHETRALQALFIAERFESTLPEMLALCAPELRAQVERSLNELLKDPRGVYALIDYRHFKGSGTSPAERYRGEGWGVLQVLQAMQPSNEPLSEFVRCAKMILTRRVQNAPEERHESRWLKGWCNRIEGYL